MPTRRILIADDNVDALDSLALLLQCEGHEVFKAADGAEALEVAAAQRPDVAFFDLGMPVLSGYEAAVRIRAEPWSRSLMLIALSGWGQPADVCQSRACGFDAHLVKPASLENLNEVLSRATGARHHSLALTREGEEGAAGRPRLAGWSRR